MKYPHHIIITHKIIRYTSNMFRLLSNYKKTVSTTVCIGLGLGYAYACGYADDIFGDDTFTGEEIRYLKSLGFKKRCTKSFCQWQPTDSHLIFKKLNDEYIDKINNATTDDECHVACQEALQFNPFLLPYVDSRFINEDMLDNARSSMYPYRNFDIDENHNGVFMTSMSREIMLALFESYCHTHTMDDDKKNRLVEYVEKAPTLTTQDECPFDQYLITKKFKN